MPMPSPLPALPDWRNDLARYDAAIVKMHREEGLTYGQIGRKLGLTRGAVAGRAYRHADRVRLNRVSA